jgi:hypothetical protein
MALEALEESCTPRLSTWHYAAYDAAITALKAALEQPEQRREWRGLTEEEIESIWDGYLSDYQLQMIRTIEDKLKEKNAL